VARVHYKPVEDYWIKLRQKHEGFNMVEVEGGQELAKMNKRHKTITASHQALQVPSKIIRNMSRDFVQANFISKSIQIGKRGDRLKDGFSRLLHPKLASQRKHDNELNKDVPGLKEGLTHKP